MKLWKPRWNSYYVTFKSIVAFLTFNIYGSNFEVFLNMVLNSEKLKNIWFSELSKAKSHPTVQWEAGCRLLLHCVCGRQGGPWGRAGQGGGGGSYINIKRVIVCVVNITRKVAVLSTRVSLSRRIVWAGSVRISVIPVELDRFNMN